MTAAYCPHPFVARDEERIDVEFALIEGHFCGNRVDLILRFLLECQQLSNLSKHFAVEQRKVLGINRHSATRGGRLQLVFVVEIRLRRQVEIGSTAERAEHWEEGIHLRNHVYEFLYVDIGHVVIQSAEDMIAARRLV